VLSRLGGGKSLLFIHGSGAGGWVFEEHWLPFFAAMGFDAYTLSLRGSFATGFKDTPGANRKGATVSQHISDIKDVIRKIYKRGGGKGPIILGHSFGGLLVSKLLEDSEGHALIQRAGWLCSLPPTGQGPMSQRFLYTRFPQTINILRAFLFGQINNKKLNRQIFYDSSVTDDKLAEYMARLALDAGGKPDLADVESALPSRNLNPDGSATWLSAPGSRRLKFFVLGSNDDYIVDPQAVLETAKYVDAKPVLIDGPGHNIMLGERWRVAADQILLWLKQ